jgi:hypothetical protein
MSSSSGAVSTRRRIQRKVSARIDALFRDTVEPNASGSTAAASTSASDPLLTTTCQPWSREDFFSRVESFTPLRWFAKGDALSPLLCASQGWHCTDVDQVSCATCGALVSVSDIDFGSHDSTDGDRNAVVTARLQHNARCPWREIVCPARFSHAPLHADGMRQQYRDALPLLFELKRVPCVLPELIATHVSLLRKLPLYANLDCTDLTRCDTLRCLALYGWTALDRDSLLCELCRRRVDVGSVVAVDDILDELPPARRNAPLFDPLNEHRAFCPWSRGSVDAMMRAFNHRQTDTTGGAKRSNAAVESGSESLATLRFVRRALSSV